MDGAGNVADRNSSQAEGGSGNESSFDETPSTEDHEGNAGLHNDEQNGKKLGMGHNSAADQFSSRAKSGRSSKAPVEFLTVPEGVKIAPTRKMRPKPTSTIFLKVSISSILKRRKHPATETTKDRASDATRCIGVWPCCTIRPIVW